MPAPFLDPVAGPCPTVDRWQRMLAGETADAELADLRRHLDACPKCHALLDRLTEIPSLRDWAVDLSPAGRETEEQRLVKRLHEFAPLLSDPLGEPTVPAGVSPTAGSPPTQAAGPGDLVGPYRLEAELGRGGMGVVFRAKDTLLGRTAAVKLLPPGQVADPTARGRFLREARAAAGVRNDHIVVVYQVGEHGETMYLAMELLHGETLDGRLRRQGALPLADAVRFAREAAQGLAAAHAAGLVHRDIKPANLWIEGEPGAASAGGRLKILDFGLARPAAEAALTQAGVVVGTPAYMPPEQANGEAVDHRGDLFSLGCVLYHMVTGGPPFAGDCLRAVLKAVLLEAPRPPGELRPGLPPALAELIGRLLDKSPRGRPQSAAAVAEELRAIEGQIDRAPPAPPRRVSRRAVVGLGLAFLGFSGAFLYYNLRVRAHPADGASPNASTGPAAPPAAAAARPFALLARAGRPEQDFPTLAAAVAAARSGDAIEVRSDGPFLCDPIDLKSTSLTLRAAPGRRPQLRHGAPKAPVGNFLLQCSGRLALEGLEFQRFGDATSQKPGGIVNVTPPGELHLAHCLFLGYGPGTAVRSDSATLRVRRCEFLLATDIWNGLTWTPVPSRDTTRPRASVEGCLFFNREGAAGLGLVYPRELPRFSLDVVDNTFVVHAPLSIRFGARPSEAAAVRAAGKAGAIHLSGNVFVGRLGLIDHYAMREWNVLPASEAVGLYPEAFDWRDSHNAYERGMPMVWARDQPDPTKPQRTIEGLADWHKFMGVRQSTSVQGDVRFTRVSGRETDLDTLRPGQFRLAEASVGKKAGPVGRDLGADVDAVGPGAAYEAWKQTADYQRWLKDMAR